MQALLFSLLCKASKLKYMLLTVLCCLCLLPVLGCEAAGFSERVADMAEVQGVRTSSSADKARIVIDVDKATSYKQFALTGPDRVVIDIANAWLSPKADKQPVVKSPFVGKVRLAQFNPTTVRVVIENKVGKNNYNVFALKGGAKALRIVMDAGNIGPDTSQAKIALPDVKPSTQPAKPAQPSTQTAKPGTKPEHKPAAQSAQIKPAEQAGKAEQPKTQPQVQPAESDKKDKPAKKQEQPDTSATDPATEAAQNTNGTSDPDEDIRALTSLQGRTITIDPGHGGSDAGAIGPTGVMEKNVTLRISNELRRLLVAQGATVYMTRTTDTEVSPKHDKATDIEELQARCDIANKNGSDVFISIHNDSFSNGAARGTTGYYYSLGSKKSRDLADKVRLGVIEQIGTQSRGTQSCNFYVLKHTDMPATLIEVAFISNPEEEKLLDSEDGVRKAAQGIADGIADFFG